MSGTVQFNGCLFIRMPNVHDITLHSQGASHRILRTEPCFGENIGHQVTKGSRQGLPTGDTKIDYGGEVTRLANGRPAGGKDTRQMPYST